MADLMEAVTSLAKRRGIAFQSSEIYGGLRSSWDYGPLGTELKRNVREQWWRSTVQLRDDVVGLEAAVIMSPKVWEASGHLEVFTDPLVECLNCHQRFRADHLAGFHAAVGSRSRRHHARHGARAEMPQLWADGLHAAAQLPPHVQDEHGPDRRRREHRVSPARDGAGDVRGLRDDPAVSRKKVPFGIAQIGRSFRNEITPGNFIYRLREFEQMEMEFFVEPGTDEKWHEFWIGERMRWWTDLGMREENLRTREHDADELSHYSKRTVDIEYRFPFTDWGELEGVANRTDFDLKAHQEASGEDLTYFDQEKERRYHPYAIEPAAGVDRAVLAFLLDAYREEEAPTAKGGTENRTYLALDRRLAPTKVAVLPLSRNEKLTPEARRVFDLVKGGWTCDYDDAGSIGRRYRRQDEVGTPFCVTVDFDSLEDAQVTVRERDSMTQDRLPIDGLVAYLSERL